MININRFRFAAILLFAFILQAAPVPAAGDAVEIGSRRELFVDRFLIDRLDRAELRLHAPEPAGVALRFDNPWEGRFSTYVTVIHDGDLYRMYYRGLPHDKGEGSNVELTCYAESRDGMAWTKPDLGIYEIRGTRKNNVVLSGQAPCSHNFAPFLDGRAGVPAGERYKALCGNAKIGLLGFVSGDGLHWKRFGDKALITQGQFDSQNVAFWSEAEGQYCCYFRTWTGKGLSGIRSISRVTSKDFAHWSEPVQMDFGAPQEEHFYTNQTQPYFRAPQIYLALAARFCQGKRILSKEQFAALGGAGNQSGDCSDGVLMSSRGGNRYDRTFREALIRPGPELANWNSRSNYPASGIVQTGPGEMSVYVDRRYAQLQNYLERLKIRLDGFVSVSAGYGGGELLTKPLRFSGKRLTLNYATSAAGSLKVEILDLKGQPLPGYALPDADEIVGDQVERVVTWKGRSDLSALAPTPIRLRFVMQDADLYSLRFGE